jgi:hypothetical protein
MPRRRGRVKLKLRMAVDMTTSRSRRCSQTLKTVGIAGSVECQVSQVHLPACNACPSAVAQAPEDQVAVTAEGPLSSASPALSTNMPVAPADVVALQGKVLYNQGLTVKVLIRQTDAMNRTTEADLEVARSVQRQVSLAGVLLVGLL